MACLNEFKELFTSLITKCLYYNSKRDKSIWVLGEWYGERCCDNSAFFANFLASSCEGIKVFWLTNENVDTSLLNKKITQLIIDSPEAISILKVAAVVIFNQSVRDITHTNNYYIGGALTVNFWHGSPWKKIGGDAIRGGYIKKSYNHLTSKLFDARFFLAYSEPFAEIMSHAYHVPMNRVIKAGYPRNSFFYNTIKVAEKKKEIVEKINKKYNKNYNEDIKIVAYMPSFRDLKGNEFSFKSIDLKSRIDNILINNKAIIIQKAHYVSNNRNEFSEIGVSESFVYNENTLTAQDLLAAADVLITDYSGAIFDYLILDRPIIHYLYDYEYYKNRDRGLYFEKDEVLSGDEADNIDELFDALEINLNDASHNHDLRKLRRAKFLEYESDDSCRKIYDYIIEHL